MEIRDVIELAAVLLSFLAVYVAMRVKQGKHDVEIAQIKKDILRLEELIHTNDNRTANEIQLLRSDIFSELKSQNRELTKKLDSLSEGMGKIRENCSAEREIIKNIVEKHKP